YTRGSAPHCLRQHVSPSIPMCLPSVYASLDVSYVLSQLVSLRPPRLLLFGANATICCSMSPTDTGQSGACRPRVGIPWRTSAEEEEATISGKRGKTQDYMSAVERAGAEGVLVPLKDEPA